MNMKKQRTNNATTHLKENVVKYLPVNIRTNKTVVTKCRTDIVLDKVDPWNKMEKTRNSPIYKKT